jgi:hypothetical protein
MDKKIQLTDKVVRALKLRPHKSKEGQFVPYRVYNLSGPQGFHIYVSANGNKAWILATQKEARRSEFLILVDRIFLRYFTSHLAQYRAGERGAAVKGALRSLDDFDTLRILPLFSQVLRWVFPANGAGIYNAFVMRA